MTTTISITDSNEHPIQVPQQASPKQSSTWPSFRPLRAFGRWLTGRLSCDAIPSNADSEKMQEGRDESCEQRLKKAGISIPLGAVMSDARLDKDKGGTGPEARKATLGSEGRDHHASLCRTTRVEQDEPETWYERWVEDWLQRAVSFMIFTGAVWLLMRARDNKGFFW